MTTPETPSVELPSMLPTEVTSINYPLVYGLYAVWPYAAPLSFTNGSSLPSGQADLSMRPTPVVVKAYATRLEPPASSARISVIVPASADLWFQGMKVPEQGTLRRFASPELNPMLAYVYDVRAVWLDKDHWVSQSQRILVRAGDNLTIAFPRPLPTSPAPHREALPPPPTSSVSPGR